MSNASSIPSASGSSVATVTQGSAWISARATQRAAAQQTFASDPKYKKYTQQVEKCLNSFENIHEWADCIAFLKQLLKTFQSYMQFKEIPRKLIVAKRLAQCLNPALPTGVHQRALDVYSHILAVLGPEGLRVDLAVWSSGLFPFFEYAATSVKPALLNLFDTHYLPLQSGLRPIMKSFIIALLPGLEEETSEFFDKVLNLLDRLSRTVSPSFFFETLWLIMLTTPSARGTSLNYLARRLNTNEDISDVVGKDMGLMIRAFASALEDDDLLVRRGALDILLQSLRVDSPAIRKAQTNDRAILMRAATGVVLRRDLSLNRRLYTWLLGSDEKNDRQMDYFKEHALELLRTTLQNEMLSPSKDYSESRPFKIFVSLLDKWEIGAPLTQVLVYDALRAIKSLVNSSPDGSDDVVKMTANTLYEAVEPQIMWKQLLVPIFAEIVDGSQFEAIQMGLFVLKTFAQDEEIQTIHLPVVFSAILDIVNYQRLFMKTPLPPIRETLHLLEEMLQHIPQPSLMQRPHANGQLEPSIADRPFLFACNLYGISSLGIPEGRGSFAVPVASAFESLASLSLICAQNLINNSENIVDLREVFSSSLILMERLSERLTTFVEVSWEPSNWLQIILQGLHHESATFMMIDRVISLLIILHKAENLEPRPFIDDRQIIGKIVTKLLRYLQPNCSAYHVRAVNLILSLDATTKNCHIESILAQTLTSLEFRNVGEPYEAFGVLWRLTEDNLLPGFCFKVPMMIVLDTLKSDDPNLRRIGETWMRCSLKSYLRILDPFLNELLDPSIQRAPSTARVNGKELQIFVYERQFDQRYISHLLDLLLTITRFGGQGFAKTAGSTPIRRSYHAGLVERVETGGLIDQDTSYLDVLIEVVLRFIQSEPSPSHKTTMGPTNAVIQSTAVDLLQTIVVRGDVDGAMENIEAIVIRKLYYSIHLHRLDLQNKLLHLLHSIISASTADDLASQTAQNQNYAGKHQGSASSSTIGHDSDPGPPGYSANPLLIQALVDGIADRRNRPVLQHWLDFILMAVPQFQPALQGAIGPLNDCLCRQLDYSLQDILASARNQDSVQDALSMTTDAEMIMLLNGLERMVLLSLANISATSLSEDEPTTLEKSSSENTGLLGYVSTVFASEGTQQISGELLTVRSPAYKSLDEGIRVLYSVWGALAWSNPSTSSSKDESLLLISSRTRMRCRRVLENLFRVQPVEVFESLVDCWSRFSASSNIPRDAAFELVDVLITNVQTAVHMMCESISYRLSGVSEKIKRQAINPNLNDALLFKFLGQYFRRLEGPLIVRVWGRFLQLVKDIGAMRDFRTHHFLALSCLSVLAEKMSQTTALEDRRIRKEFQEHFGKLLDSSLTFVGRSYDQGSWIRRSTKDSLATNGRESPALRDTKSDDKIDASLPLDTPKPAASAELVMQINEFVASCAIPNLRKFLVENDKIVSTCNNIVYYIVNPAMRGKTRPLDIDPTVLAMIREMAKIPATIKAWKTPVVEILNDNRLFNCNGDSARQWSPIVRTLFETDKSALPELLAKVATAPSANIFTNREYEILLRSLNVRRLSYVLFTGDKNHFLTQLPVIQEKLVDIFKNVTSPVVQSEVFLLIRVLLCRLSPNNLTSFWPVLLTELYRIFDQTLTTLPIDGSEDLLLILAASKCLDLLLVLQTPEFQIHHWMFVTDTVDAIYHPDNWFPEAMMDQLAEIVGALPVAGTTNNGFITPHLGTIADQQHGRQPLLNSLRQIESVRDLIPFFSNVSITSYESVYASGGNVDWEAVESGILNDMFDGR